MCVNLYNILLVCSKKQVERILIADLNTRYGQKLERVKEYLNPYFFLSNLMKYYVLRIYVPGGL